VRVGAKCRSRSSGSPSGHAHVTEFRLAEPEIAKTERQIDIRVELCQEPSGVAVGGEEFDDGLEVEALVLAVDACSTNRSIVANGLHAAESRTAR
jgi:hypothetical protein